MAISKFTQTNIGQFIFSFLAISVTVACCYFFRRIVSYEIIALILLLVVSLIATSFKILPVLFTAILSAIALNFFFIKPIFTFKIEGPKDALLFLMYFAVTVINAVFTNKIRKAKKKILENEEREKTIKLYDTMLNSLSHELRTPISTIIGASDALLESNQLLTNENKIELITEIGIAGARLNRQVENLLNMSKLEAGFLKPRLDWIDSNELIFRCIHSINTTNHRIDFSMEDNFPLVKTDKILLEQIIHNILHNAIQHTPNNTLIEIKTSKQNNLLIIIIQDNGTGFPNDLITFAFDKFYRLPTSGAGGTGLGLSIAKGFAESLNGTIHLENRTHGGAQFTLSIPVEFSTITQLDDE